MKDYLAYGVSVFFLSFVKALGMFLSCVTAVGFALLVFDIHWYQQPDLMIPLRNLVGFVAALVLFWVFFTLNQTQRCFDWDWKLVKRQENTSTETFWLSR